MSADLRAIAREQNQRDALAPIGDPSILRLVALRLAAWRAPGSSQEAQKPARRAS